jgi:gas vesicle protein
MAVENTVLSMGLTGFDTFRDKERREVLEIWHGKIGNLTADRIYRKLREEGLGVTEILELSLLFKRDEHDNWAEAEVLEISEAQWKKISERIKAELKSFSEDKNDDKTLLQNLEEATKEKYDYGDFLRKFSVSGEDIQINDDEFDYVYYTYGLSLYGNLPLVEPLEYKDINKIKEFVVAIDTSGSCRGEIVQAFLNKTYSILKSSENFFRKVNIHIIQCDSQVRQDIKITNDDEFEAFMREGKLEGFGSTDFRPVFEHVNKAIENGEFENLKGLIYFTDGYGVFPEKKPPYNYDTAFVFLEDDFEKPPVPPWAIKLILPVEDIEAFDENI